MNGILYIVATPIGNLEDLSPRAQRVLSEVDLIVAEDTRHSMKLMRHFGIKTSISSLHEYNERDRLAPLLSRLQKGESIAQISDAGTPLVSDPGYLLVRAATEAGFRVTAVPGPSALLMALTISGLPLDRFCFEGFLPARQGERLRVLESLATESRTMIFFDSPRRVLDSLYGMQQVFGGERRVAVARELTKLHESIHCAPLTELIVWMEASVNRCRGEFVLVVEGQAKSANDVESLRIANLLASELPPRKAVGLAAEITGDKKNRIYRKWLEQK